MTSDFLPVLASASTWDRFDIQSAKVVYNYLTGRGNENHRKNSKMLDTDHTPSSCQGMSQNLRKQTKCVNWVKDVVLINQISDKGRPLFKENNYVPTFKRVFL